MSVESLIHPTFLDEMKQLGIPSDRLNYDLFLKSHYWWRCKQTVLQRDGRCCANCRSANRLHIHHKTYANHGNELNNLGDLMILCRDCHALAHGKPWLTRSGAGYPENAYLLALLLHEVKHARTPEKWLGGNYAVV